MTSLHPAERSKSRAPGARRASMRPGAQPGIRPLDLSGRERQLRAAMGAMTKISLTFARESRKSLPFLVRQRARVAPSNVAIMDPNGPDFATVGPSVEVLLECSEGLSWAIVRMDAGALSVVLEGTLGGRDTTSNTKLGRELSPAQRALVSSVTSSLAADFARSVESESGVQLLVQDVRTLGDGEERTLPESDGLTVRCGFDGIEAEGAIIIACSGEGLEAAVRDQDVMEPTAGDPKMPDAMMGVPVPVVAELGRLTLGLRRVLTLKVGDVVRLNSAVDDPIDVRVADLDKLAGVPVVSRGQLAVRIESRHGE